MLSIRPAARWTATIRTTRSRYISTSVLSQLVQRPVQSYTSTSSDPFLNLSIEHHLLRNTPPDSAVLFLYVNRPCIVIGRNQNPWLEVNIPLLRDKSGNVDLVRRRSGGGTVFHDEGNVNWTVIVHPSIFTRDKHCDMIVRALHSCGINQAKVNDRHDVVVDQSDGRARKVSGSAYKLIRNRALHHGTCLLSSPNLSQISQYLRSPVKKHITAKGVESVSSPIANVGLTNTDFIQAVRQQFDGLYPGQQQDAYTFGQDCMDVDSIRRDVEEMKSSDWMFLQTPQFTVKTPQTVDGATLLELDVRHGIIEGSKLSLRGVDEVTAMLEGELVGKSLHEISDWSRMINPREWPIEHRSHGDHLVEWLQQMFPGVDSPE